MKAAVLSLAILAGASCASPLGLTKRQGTQKSDGGTGPYAPANYTTDESLANHTIYLPKVPAGVKVPVLVWGEGGCSANGLSFAQMLTQFASYGIMVIASGAPGGTGRTTSRMMTEAINWISAKAGNAQYAAVDTTRIAAAGMSCGGLEAYDMDENDKVSFIGIFNSGFINKTEAISKIRKPVFYFLGGESDIAYKNGERDYKDLPAGTPSWKGNIPVGHGGTYSKKDGGEFGNAGLRWLQWTLQGNTTAAKYFTEDGSKVDKWAAESKNLDKLKPLGGS